MYIVKITKGYTELSFAFSYYDGAARFMETCLVNLMPDEKEIVVSIALGEDDACTEH